MKIHVWKRARWRRGDNDRGHRVEDMGSRLAGPVVLMFKAEEVRGVG